MSLLSRFAKTVTTALDRATLRKELVAGSTPLSGYLQSLNRQLNALPIYIDDAEQDFGTGIYDRMLRDPMISSSFRALKIQVLADGISLVNPKPPASAYNPDGEAEAAFNRAEELREWMVEVFDNLQAPMDSIVDELLDYLAFGHAIAEMVFTLDGGQITLSKLQPKPRNAYAFVVTQMMDVLGVVSADVNTGNLIQVYDVTPEQVVPREKLLMLSNDPMAGDPRGTSVLRPAYNAWYLKQQTWPAMLKYNIQFGTPSVLGKTPPDAPVVTDSTGTEVSAATAMVEKLVAWSSGTAIAVDAGAEIQLIESKGDGSNFTSAIDLYNREMARAILVALRATMESEHGSRADSETASELVHQYAQGVRRRVERAIQQDVIEPLIRMNFGEEAVEFAPMFSLADMSPGDTSTQGTMIANLARAGLIHTSQYQGIDVMLGLPERDMEAQLAEQQEQAERDADRRAMLDLGAGTSEEPQEEDPAEEAE